MGPVISPAPDQGQGEALERALHVVACPGIPASIIQMGFVFGLVWLVLVWSGSFRFVWFLKAVSFLRCPSISRASACEPHTARMIHEVSA